MSAVKKKPLGVLGGPREEAASSPSQKHVAFTQDQALHILAKVDLSLRCLNLKESFSAVCWVIVSGGKYLKRKQQNIV